MRLFDKRAIQLSINFLVTFILALVIFGAGIVLIRTMTDNAETDLNTIQRSVNDKIQSLSCSAKDKLCLSNNEATVERGNVLYFGVHVNNYLSKGATFRINIDQSQNFVEAYDSKDNPIEWGKITAGIRPLPITQTVTIDPKKQGEKGFAMVVDKAAIKGQYFYPINVECIEPVDCSYEPVRDILIFSVR